MICTAMFLVGRMGSRNLKTFALCHDTPAYAVGKVAMQFEILMSRSDFEM